MLETKSTEIRGAQVMSTQLPALKAYALMPKLGKVIAPALSKLDSIDLTADLSSLAPAFQELFMRLDEGDAEDLATRILASTIVIKTGPDGSPRKYELSSPQGINNAFAGDLRLMFECIWFALRTNYESFIDADSLQGAIAQAQAAATKASESK